MESTVTAPRGLMTPAKVGGRGGSRRLAVRGAGPVEGELERLLARATAVLDGLGDRAAPARRALASLRERLVEGRFHLAVLGQFKRGKSTLLNALLVEPLLPAAVIPLTSVPTLLRAGDDRRVRVFYEDGRPPDERAGGPVEELAAFLARFVSEEANPCTRLGVERVEVSHPAPLLRRGVVLIDTPGIGSTHRHNTETTLRFLPQCDAALFVVSADPPLTEAELEFLREARARVPRLFFVLNKVDYLAADELSQAVRFLRGVLRERLGVADDVPLLCVSARQGLAARVSGDAALWRASGLEALERHLVEFLAAEKEAALREAVAAKAGDILEGALLQVRLATRSLQLPLEELEERLRAFEERLGEAERQRLVAGDLLRGERDRLAAFLEQQAEDLRRKARDHLQGIVEEHLAHSPEPDGRAVGEAFAVAIPEFFGRELREVDGAFSARVREALEPHQRRAEELIQSVRRAAAELFDVPYRPWGGADRLELTHRPYWVTQRWSASLNEIHADLLERLLPRAARRERLRRRLRGQVEALVLHNVENLRWATLQNLDLTIRRFEAALAERLKEAADATRGAIQAALARRAERAEAVHEEVGRLERLAAELEGLRQLLAAPARQGTASKGANSSSDEGGIGHA